MTAATPAKTITDGRQRAVVLVVTLAAIAIDGAAEPATGAILSTAAQTFGNGETLALLAKAGFSVAYDLAILASLWLIANHGKRGYFRGSLLGYATACVVAAVAPDPGIYVAARILQGACLGGLFACALLTMVGISPPQRLPLVFALFTILALAAPELAPLVAALVNASAGWRAVFAVLAVLPLLGGVIVTALMKDVDPPAPRFFDTGSFLAAAIFLVTFSVISERAGSVGLENTDLVVTIVLSVAALAWFLLRELALARTPFVDLRPFSLRLVGQGLTACIALGVVLGGSASFVTFAIRALHLPPLGAVALSATAFLGAALGTVLVYLIGTRNIASNQTTTVSGALLLALTYAAAALCAMNQVVDVWPYALVAIVEGCALALIIGPLAGLLFDAVPHDQFGALALLFKIALILGAAIAVPILGRIAAQSALWMLFALLLVALAALVATLPKAKTKAA